MGSSSPRVGKSLFYLTKHMLLVRSYTLKTHLHEAPAACQQFWRPCRPLPMGAPLRPSVRKSFKWPTPNDRFPSELSEMCKWPTRNDHFQNYWVLVCEGGGSEIVKAGLPRRFQVDFSFKNVNSLAKIACGDGINILGVRAFPPSGHPEPRPFP